MTKDTEAKLDLATPAREHVGQTLLELIMADALILVLEMANERVRLTANLHPLATRSLFLTTRGVLTNQQLLELLNPDTASRGMRDARNLRTVGQERGLKVGDLSRHAVSLLKSSALTKADVVRAWTYTLIHSSALAAISEVRAKRSGFDSTTLFRDPQLANQTLNKCHDLTWQLLRQQLDVATKDVEKNRPNSEQQRFLQYAASLVLEAMGLERPVLAAYTDLLENVFPEIDRYTFEKP